MRTFYIADLHFGHEKILIYDSRPFSDITENDEELIRRWNSAVGRGDEVWILGDVSWRSPAETAALLRRMNGVKRLCVGNHDSTLIRNAESAACFEEITPYKEIRLAKNYGAVLCHYPIPCFNRHMRGWVHLYGHVHNTPEWKLMEETRRRLEEKCGPCNMINAGCMMEYMDYTPRTLEEILEGYEGYLNEES